MFPPWVVVLILVGALAVLVCLAVFVVKSVKQENRDGAVLKKEQDAFLDAAHKQNRMNRPMD